MPNDKILSTLSLARKAGEVVSGEFSTQKAVREGRALLVVVAEDASENTRKKMESMTAYYKVPLYYYSNKEELARAIGEDYRSMAAVTHPGFADSLEKQLRSAKQRNREG